MATRSLYCFRSRLSLKLKVRLANIDAPELGQAFAQRSQQHLSELVFGREGRIAHSRAGPLLSGTGDRVFLALLMVFLGWQLH
jgi:hypothetical protein